MKLGSLFDGSGTAPLCAAILGWEPVWASEIEPFPIKVTSKRFPRMKHLGDITKINGAEIEPVDVIVGGSPCQDLSVAGKQAGLQNGTRSHLFYEMTRIIKEMRNATNGRYPRYIIWENVPGAFSSNQGRDFYEVLKAFCACADHPCNVPEPPRGKGRVSADKLVWGNAGLIMGDGFSLGWRVLDAQYWGVPQRRRRIFLAVDLGGGRAREILFEREGLCRDPEQSGKARESAAAAAVGCTDRGGGDRLLPLAVKERAGKPGGGKGALWGEDRSFTLSTNTDEFLCYAIEGNTVDRNSAQNGCGYCENISPTLDAQDRHAVAAFMGGQGEKAGGIGYCEKCSPTLKAIASGTNAVPDVVYPNIARTLTAEHDSSPCIDRGQNITAYTADCRYVYDCRGNGDGKVAPNLTGDHQNRVTDYSACIVEKRAFTADCRNGVLNATDLVLYNGKPPRRYIVRRLTPMECSRLQGFPDWWVYGCEKQPITGWWLENTDWMRVIDPHGEVEGSDSAIYKMWGNGMALPCMLFVLSGLEGCN